jgi:hypothetical protein
MENNEIKRKNIILFELNGLVIEAAFPRPSPGPCGTERIGFPLTDQLQGHGMTLKLNNFKLPFSAHPCSEGEVFPSYEIKAFLLGEIS